MSKYKKKQIPSAETIEEAVKVAKGIQKPGQSKEQTRLIAQGIQKGIAEYKKQQKSKSHELDKLKKKLAKMQESPVTAETPETTGTKCKTQWFPWILLIISWLSMAVFLLLHNAWGV